MDKLATGAARLDISLTEEQLARFEIYYRDMVAGNRRLNLTAITGYEDVQVKHFLDSLTVAMAFETGGLTGGLSVIDVGAGAGLPGLPLKLAFPAIKLTLLEATAKKADFLRRLKDNLGLDEVAVVNARAEDAAREDDFRQRFDLVLSRAVAVLPALVELALPFCRVGGRLIAQKKGDIREEIDRAARAIEEMEGRLVEVRRVELEEFDDNRCLVVIDKGADTPEKYPRRAGMPVKRPLV